MDDTTREIEIMKLMVHPNLIELYEVLKDEKFIYLVLEFMAVSLVLQVLFNPAAWWLITTFRCREGL